MNKITLAGRLTKDIEFIHKGKKLYAKGCVASNKKFKKNGKIQQETIYFNFLIKGKLAEFVSEQGEKVTKGKVVHLGGSLSQRHYVDSKGAKSTFMRVIVDEISFMEQAEFSDEVLDEFEKKANEALNNQSLTDEQIENLSSEMEADLIYALDLNGEIIGARSNETDDDGEELPFI